MDSGGSLSEEAIARVLSTLADYRAEIDSARRCKANLAVLTSAVRDASNGAAFAARVREDFGLDARVLSGSRRGPAHVPRRDVRLAPAPPSPPS